VKVKNIPQDSGVELGNLETAGTRVWSYTGREFGLTLGWTPRQYTGEAGNSDRIAVYWPDGQVSWPCTRGIRDRGGKWQIA
jgi:hypothetical protein